MSLQNDQSLVSYTGNNSAVTPYVIPFYFLENSHIAVVVIDSDDNETGLVYGTDYTLTGEGDETGGTMKTAAAYSSSYTIIIRRDVPATQLTDYNEADEFPADSHERALDKLTMICQQLFRQIANVIRVSDVGTALNTLIRKATTVIGFDGSGQPRTYTPTELQDFLNLSGAPQFDRPMFTVADAGARALATPDYTGQLLTQQDTGELYIAGSTTTGDWDLYVPDVPTPDGLLPTGGTSGQVLTKSSDTNFDVDWQTPAEVIGNKSINGSFTNLRVQNYLDRKILVDVDEIVFNLGDQSIRFTSPAQKTCDFDADGAGGLDEGAAGINEWYYLFFISDGATLETTLSLSPSNPTLQSGYIYKTLISAVRLDAFGFVVDFWQTGNRIYVQEQYVLDGVTGHTSLQSQSIANFVPPIAVTAFGIAGHKSTATLWVNVASRNDGLGINYGQPLANKQNGYWNSHSPFEVPLLTSQTIYWSSQSTGSGYSIAITGFTLGLNGSGSGGSNSTQNDYESVSFSSAGTTTLSKTLETNSFLTWDVTADAGSTDYTRTLVLDSENCRTGDRAEIIARFPSSTQPTLTIRNATSGGTILWGPQSGSSSGTSTIVPRFVYTGTAWIDAGLS